ncbi:squalene synthase HpnC [Actinomadura viridis]|uniref:squalene synthase HpnC n=1 Tax=Actinomadura viridis TaxID=58110 RepID=UPI0036C184BD
MRSTGDQDGPAAAGGTGRAAQENFPVASRLLPRRYRADLMAVYGFARTVDDIGDEAPPDRRGPLLDEVDRDLDHIYAGRPAILPVMVPLARTIAGHGIPAEPFRKLVRANRQDQEVLRYDTFADLLAYCALSADPVGHIVLYLFGAATPERLELSDRVCSALQILEHCQDVREDHEKGRVYIPAEDLRRFGCVEDDLRAARTPTRLRGVLALEADRAGRMLEEGAPIAAGLPPWARLAVSGYIAGGRATHAALRRGAYDVLGTRLHPRPARLLTEWLRVLVGGGAAGGGAAGGGAAGGGAAGGRSSRGYPGGRSPRRLARRR